MTNLVLIVVSINGEIDFKQLKEEIEHNSQSAYKLYRLIYHSEELKRIVEAMDYKKSSLRTHLLLMVNIANSGKLKVKNGKISISAEKRD